MTDPRLRLMPPIAMAEKAKRQPLEADVTMNDGSVVRVTGLLAVKFRTDPDGVRLFLEELRAERRRDKGPPLSRETNGELS